MTQEQALTDIKETVTLRKFQNDDSGNPHGPPTEEMVYVDGYLTRHVKFLDTPGGRKEVEVDHGLD
jgi:hypothetical protein